MRVFLAHTPEMFAGYYGDRALAALRRHAEVVRNPGDTVLSGAALAEAARGCQAIVADRATPGTAETFAAAPDLVAFLRVAVDISTIDVAAASAAGVLVTRATPGFVDSVAELALGFLVDLARGVSGHVQAYRRGQEPAGQMGTQLSAATLGIVGYGRIGQRLAEVALALGMRVLAADPHACVSNTRVLKRDFAEVLAESDFVVCLAISLPETRDLFDAAAFARMKPGARFINLSRGELVDEQALAAALDSGRLAGAAMDVGRAADQRPSLFLAQRPDVIAAPHIGGMTPEAMEHQAMDTVRQVAALAIGKMPDNAVNAAAALRLSRLKSPAK
ncbi:hydroxyacid dehydrogenase [Roseomonas sp. HJA6]|uniref:Hydroxyacid dehydrogenase n=1 Tax=Roseomonas alba TaxID=2846776 RepID=A0ABS7ACY2_9PROT|nr:NAD(P)-dependent oxidoreductase [Neoroseomonas alba]MBW6400168.1 hydroxyacid dehydrogenase [Neoroseomonas alba]